MSLVTYASDDAASCQTPPLRPFGGTVHVRLSVLWHWATYIAVVRQWQEESASSQFLLEPRRFLPIIDSMNNAHNFESSFAPSEVRARCAGKPARAGGIR